MKKISLSACSVRGKSFWRVRWHDERGKVRRQFFSAKAAAEAKATSLRGQKLSTNNRIALVPSDERERMLFVWNEAKRLGIDLVAALKAPQKSTSKPIGEVIKEHSASKLAAGRDTRYTHNLTLVLHQFAKGRERVPIHEFGLEDVASFLAKKNLVSRQCFRGRLSTLFSFAVRKGYMVADPCRRLESITVSRAHPHVFTVEEVKKCLDWLKKNPALFGWFVLATFAGLRPEEAEQTTWQDINFAEGWIKIEAQTSKIRQRRVVYPKPMVFEWLRLAKQRKTKMPFCSSPTLRTRQRQMWRLRDLLGWKTWKHDITRHTCASMWFSECGSAATVATALGHSESIMRKNYMALVTKADAEKFWKLR